MTIDEFKKYVSITEIKGDCVRVKANDGYMLKLGDSYTEELFCERSAIPDNLVVVPYSTYLIESNKEKYKGMTVEEAKEKLIAEIAAYDKSPSVNSFLLNDKQRWLDVDLRRSLSYSTNILKEDGEKTVDIWFDTECETMDIDNVLYMLKTLEVYAKQTNNVTHQHKAEVLSLTSIEEVESYDITKGYPDKLIFSNEKLSETVSNL